VSRKGYREKKDYGEKKIIKEFTNKKLVSVVCEEVADDD